MRVIYNDYLPFKGFKAINLFGVCFVRKDAGKMLPRDYNHESIHTEQMKELGYVFFYIIYLFEWVAKLFVYGKRAYSKLSFEREAYENQYNFNYLKNRKHFAQWRRK